MRSRGIPITPNFNTVILDPPRSSLNLSLFSSLMAVAGQEPPSLDETPSLRGLEEDDILQSISVDRRMIRLVTEENELNMFGQQFVQADNWASSAR